MKIVITGNIASGKSTIIKWLQENPNDSCVIDADLVVHQLYKTKELKETLKKAFGKQVISKDNEVDRKILGSIVFSDTTQLEKLNQVTQEPIRQALETQITSSLDTHSNIFIEATLAVERNWLSFFDYSICITCPDDLRLERLMTRNSLSRADAQNRIDSQMPQDQKCKACDFTLNNKSSQKELIEDFKRILNQLNN